jgi:hypothetical protein
MEKVFNAELKEKYSRESVEEVLESLKVAKDPRIIDQLKFGQQSDLIRDMKLPDGRVRDGKITIRNGKDGVPEAHFNILEKKAKLEIPQKINGKKLNKQEQEDLKNGKAIVLSTATSKMVVKIDPQLNKVSVNSPGEIGIPKQVGGYTLNNEDIKRLAEGKSMDTKVFHDPKTGQYFTGQLSLSADRNGLELSDIRKLSLSQALELKERLNNDIVKDKTNEKGSGIEAAVNTMQDSIEKNSKKVKENESSVNKESKEKVAAMSEANKAAANTNIPEDKKLNVRDATYNSIVSAIKSDNHDALVKAYKDVGLDKFNKAISDIKGTSVYANASNSMKMQIGYHTGVPHSEVRKEIVQEKKSELKAKAQKDPKTKVLANKAQQNEQMKASKSKGRTKSLKP